MGSYHWTGQQTPLEKLLFCRMTIKVVVSVKIENFHEYHSQCVFIKLLFILEKVIQTAGLSILLVLAISIHDQIQVRSTGLDFLFLPGFIFQFWQSNDIFYWVSTLVDWCQGYSNLDLFYRPILCYNLLNNGNTQFRCIQFSLFYILMHIMRGLVNIMTDVFIFNSDSICSTQIFFSQWASDDPQR